jgi:membrane protease YdiL (CAAX protease family)
MLTPAFLLWSTCMVHFEQAKTSFDAIVGATLLMAGVAVAEELLFRGVLFQRLVAALGV